MQAFKLPRLKGVGVGIRTETCVKIGWTYRHGTVFAPRKYVHQKEATDMKSPEMCSSSRCKKPSYQCGPSKLTHLKGVGIGPVMETCVNWVGPIAMVSCLHQGNIYIKRNLREWRAHKYTSLVGAKSPLISAGCQTIPSQGSR